MAKPVLPDEIRSNNHIRDRGRWHRVKVGYISDIPGYIDLVLEDDNAPDGERILRTMVTKKVQVRR